MKRAKKIIDNVYWVGVRDLNTATSMVIYIQLMKVVHIMPT